MSSPVIYRAGHAFAGLPGAFELVHRLNALRASLSKGAAILLDQIVAGTTAEKPGAGGSGRTGTTRFDRASRGTHLAEVTIEVW